MQIPPALHFSLATRNSSGLDASMRCPFFPWPLRWAVFVSVALSFLAVLRAEEAALARLVKNVD